MSGDAEKYGVEIIIAPSLPVAPHSLVRLSEVETVRAHVDFACITSDGDVALIGWLYDPQNQVQGFCVVRDPQQDSTAQGAPDMESSIAGDARIGLKRVVRRDVAQAMGKDGSAKSIDYGFALVVPGMGAEAKLVLMLADGRYADLPFTASDDMSQVKSVLPQYWRHSGPALLDTLRFLLGEENTLTRLVKELDDRKAMIGAQFSFAACDRAVLLENRVLIITGWVAKASAELERIEVAVADRIIDVTQRIVRYTRPDLESVQGVQSQGFLCVLPLDIDVTETLTINFVCHSGMGQVIERDLQSLGLNSLGSLLRGNFELAWQLLGLMDVISGSDDKSGPLAVLRRNCFLAHVTQLPSIVDKPGRAIAEVELAYPLGSAGLLLYGWKIAPGRKPRAVLLRGSKGEVLDISSHCIPVFRPDVSEKYRSQLLDRDDWCGFVCIAPVPTCHGDVRALCLDFDDSSEVWIKVPVASEVQESPRLVRQLLQLLPPPQYRDVLVRIGAALDQASLFASAIDKYEDEKVGRDSHSSFFACDWSYVLNGKVLLVHGWIALDKSNLRQIELVTPTGDIDVTSLIRRTMRPDLATQIAWAGTNPAGFLLAIENRDLVGKSLGIRVRGSDGRRQLNRLSLTPIDWRGVTDIISANPVLEKPLLESLSATSSLEPDDACLQHRIQSLRSDGFRARHPQFPLYFENSNTLIGAVDSAYVLGDKGILIFGWSFTPVHKPQAITLRGDSGQVLDITGSFTKLVRLDVRQALVSRFPGIDDWSGYVCFVAMPTTFGEGRALCFDFGDQGEVWLKVPTETQETTAVGLIRKVLRTIPSPDRMRHTLYTLFSGGLGGALEAVNRSRPQFDGTVEQRQFGVPPLAPINSLIVPLYGRCDFLRHQLAQFADDPDFEHSELLYVVDDPALVSETLELAARYAPLFRVPFRVLWYGENRGFAGANNIGARAARGENLLLVNSDVIPKQSGWISTLAAALRELPDAGAVGPLLLFGDDSVQHAGMYPRTDDIFPGFLLNTHKGMGAVWEGGDVPAEHPMLTAACVMLKKSDFEAVGGFDEGYVVGDFEDSDLCLALRKLGKRIWLVPQARLWHLERQSQSLGQAIGERQMITLFNGWRYMEKIRAGDISDPRTVEQSE